MRTPIVIRMIAAAVLAAGFGYAQLGPPAAQRVARSSLLPNLNGVLRENVQQTSLKAAGVRVPFIPAISGPFNYFDLRATLTQTIADLTALNNYRSAQETVRANQQLAQDARD